MKAGILAKDILQDLVALVPGEVEIDIRGVAALEVEKALKNELGADRVDVGNAQTIAHHGVGHRTAATMGGTVADNVSHHQEVVGQSLPVDDPELQLQPLFQLGSHDRVA
jgi:hypothetical protein